MTQKIDKINLSQMASGNLCLTLSEGIDWNDFENYANYVTKLIKAKIEKKIESVVTIIWEITVDKQPLMLVYDDYPSGITLESSSVEGDKKILEIFENLQKSSDNIPINPKQPSQSKSINN